MTDDTDTAADGDAVDGTAAVDADAQWIGETFTSDAGIKTPHGPQECIALPRSPAGETAGKLVDVGLGPLDNFREAVLDAVIALVSTTVSDW